jgi:hypothetical protein
VAAYEVSSRIAPTWVETILMIVMLASVVGSAAAWLALSEAVRTRAMARTPRDCWPEAALSQRYKQNCDIIIMCENISRGRAFKV